MRSSPALGMEVGWRIGGKLGVKSWHVNLGLRNEHLFFSEVKITKSGILEAGHKLNFAK